VAYFWNGEKIKIAEFRLPHQFLVHSQNIKALFPHQFLAHSQNTKNLFPHQFLVHSQNIPVKIVLKC
jgi:hypothetical protein